MTENKYAFRNIGRLTTSEFENEMRGTLTAQNSLFNNPGVEQTITTTTQIMGKVNETVYYELDGQKLSDFVPIEVGYGAFSTKILQAAVTASGTDFKSCLIAPQGGRLKLDGYTEIEVGTQEFPNNFFRDTYSISKEGAEIASRAMIPFDLLQQKEKARRKKFDLGLQDAWFNGLDDGKSYGLLNQPGAVVNTSFMTASIADMTDAQWQTWLSAIRALYNTLTSATANFTRLCIPQSDYFALDRVFGQFGMTRRQLLDEILKANGAKLVYTTYNETAGTGGGKRYALYKYDPDYIQGFLPLEYTPSPLYPQGAFDLISNCMAQFVTPQLKRTNTLLYLDVVPASGD